MAVWNMRIDMVKLLLDKGVDVNAFGGEREYATPELHSVTPY